jgi:hypothetical protein
MSFLLFISLLCFFYTFWCSKVGTPASAGDRSATSCWAIHEALRSAHGHTAEVSLYSLRPEEESRLIMESKKKYPF